MDTRSLCGCYLGVVELTQQLARCPEVLEPQRAQRATDFLAARRLCAQQAPSNLFFYMNHGRIYNLRCTMYNLFKIILAVHNR